MSDSTKYRLDKWLWAARFFKTRRLALEAIEGGKVKLNEQRPKPAKEVKVGDQIQVRKGPYEFHLIVEGLSVKRGPASEAQTLYRETEQSVAEREALREQLKMQSGLEQAQAGRPSKKDRRKIGAFKRGLE